MKKKLVKTVNEVNKFLKNYLAKQKKTDLIIPIKYGLFPGGKKIRSKLIFDVGKIFNVEKKYLLYLSSAVECIHAYSLIHDDLPCMDDDDIRRGKLTTHKKFGESTAVLAGNSLLTLAFEILSDPKFNINNNKKISLINLISQSSGHQGIAGGQFLDLNYERKKVSKQKVIDMEIKKTGKLFSFSCLSPVILTNKKDQIKKFSIIGEKIGLLFQIADDLIDYSSTSKTAGKKTNKDSKRGKATLISLLGYKNAIKYASKLKKEIFNSLVRKYDHIHLISPEEYNITPFYKIADVLLTEASSTIYEMLACGKPVIVNRFFKLKLSHRLFKNRLYKEFKFSP